MRLTIATWNINSVRLRINLVARFAKEWAPDVICLQETKCRDSEFPLSSFHKLGYPHVAINGQKGYHGVAIASKLPLSRNRSPRLLREGRCAPPRRDGDAGRLRLRCGCIISMCRPAATSRIRSSIRNSRTSSLFSTKWPPGWAPETLAARTRDARRRSQYRPAGDGRLEPQGAAQRRQPHAGRGREARPRSGGGAVGRRDAPLCPGGGEALHVVELSRARLGAVEPGAPPRPCLGQRKPRAAPWRHAGAWRKAAAGSALPIMCRCWSHLDL